MENNKLRVCVAGATGWAGSALSKAIITSDDLELVAGVSRSHAQGNLSEVLNLPGKAIPIFSSVEEALKIPCDVLVEYTKPDVAKSNIISALNNGVNVVVGTSGLTDEDYKDIDAIAKRNSKGVLAVGDFAITVFLLNKFAEIAAKYIPSFEIVEYAHPDKPDAPSGTARELAHRLHQIRESHLEVPIEKTQGAKESRGARIGGTQIHSVRLPGYVISIEAIFGMKDERLTIRHDSGSSAEPYVAGALLAIRKANSFTGLRRGLDSVMEL